MKFEKTKDENKNIISTKNNTMKRNRKENYSPVKNKDNEGI